MAEHGPPNAAATRWTHTLGPVAGLLLNALVWGLSWWPMRQLAEQGLHPLWANTWMFCLAAVLLGRHVPVLLRSLSAQPLMWLLMLGSGATNLGFNWAVTTGDVLRVVLLFYLMPAWSLLLAWWLLGERPNRAALLRLAVTLLGMGLVLHEPGSPWPWPRSLADALALGAGVSFALVNVLLLRLGHTPAGARMVAMFGGSALTSLLCAGLLHASGVVSDAPVLDASHLPWLLALTLAFLLGNFTLQYGAARLPAHTTALVMMSEIVFASVSSVWLGASELRATVLLGGGMIIAAAASAAWPRRSHTHRTTP